MSRSIGMIEFSSISRGLAVTDVMLKAGNTELLVSETSCPGKYITLLEGEVGAVQSAIRAGTAVEGAKIVNTLVLPHIHEGVFQALHHAEVEGALAAMGIIETNSLASIIIAADAALKAAVIRPVRLRLGTPIGGKGYFIYTGDVSAVQTAARAARQAMDKPQRFVGIDVIPSPSASLWQAVLGKRS